MIADVDVMVYLCTELVDVCLGTRESLSENLT